MSPNSVSPSTQPSSVPQSNAYYLQERLNTWPNGLGGFGLLGLNASATARAISRRY